MRKHHEVREGQIVRVIDGPLTGFRGEVKEVDEQTAKVAVQVFGRVTPMDVALGQIELVPENSNWGTTIQRHAGPTSALRQSLRSPVSNRTRSAAFRPTGGKS
jgi:hypothetical protein